MKSLLSNFLKVLLAFLPSQKMKEQRFQEKAPLRKDNISRKRWKRERNRLRRIINDFEVDKKLRRRARNLLETLRVLPTGLAAFNSSIVFLYQQDGNDDYLKFRIFEDRIWAWKRVMRRVHDLVDISSSDMLIMIDDFLDR